MKIIYIFAETIINKKMGNKIEVKKIFEQGNKIKFKVGEKYIFGEFHRYGETSDALVMVDGGLRFVNKDSIEDGNIDVKTLDKCCKCGGYEDYHQMDNLRYNRVELICDDCVKDVYSDIENIVDNKMREVILEVANKYKMNLTGDNLEEMDCIRMNNVHIVTHIYNIFKKRFGK